MAPPVVWRAVGASAVGVRRWRQETKSRTRTGACSLPNTLPPHLPGAFSIQQRMAPQCAMRETTSVTACPLSPSLFPPPCPLLAQWLIYCLPSQPPPSSHPCPPPLLSQWLAEEEKKRRRIMDEKVARRAARAKETSGSSLGASVRLQWLAGSYQLPPFTPPQSGPAI
eukprot:scaffold23155_cov46-Isochrysis_galbana.AAC.1